MEVIRRSESVLVFGGPYSNLEATQALIEEADRLGFTPERMICTGDVVAYAADTSQTVALMRDSVRHIIKGNYEESLAADGDGKPDLAIRALPCLLRLIAFAPPVSDIPRVALPGRVVTDLALSGCRAASLRAGRPG